MLTAVLFKSDERFESFKRTIEDYGARCIMLDFRTQDWIEFDYGKVDFIIYYPSFKYSSNFPLSLYDVHHNLMYIHSLYPDLEMYPDPRGIEYYNDKYKQYLFLKSRNYPIPLTYPLLSEESVTVADEGLGYPMVIKNRYGAGGNFVFKANNRREVWKYYNLSALNIFNIDSVKYFSSLIRRRMFYYYLIKKKRMVYPFLSPPLLAQEFIDIDRDLKTVVGNYKVIEAHWRIQANRWQWKVNIDGGGIGEWSRIPEGAIELSEKLARDLKTKWINIDILPSKGKYLITEFSPVWHHYLYKEKPTFVYKEDYNIDVPLEKSLNLERMIVESLMRAVKGN
jgi:hypothetical protein